MEKIGQKIVFCDKCGVVSAINDSMLKQINITTQEALEIFLSQCGHCEGQLHFLNNDEILSPKQYDMGWNKTFLEMNGYSSQEEYQHEMEQKVIKEYISKLPTFDEYAMYDRLEKQREQRERSKQNAQRRIEEEAKKPRCPHCQSTSIQPISGIKRAGSILAFGILSRNIGKQFECNDCGYKW